MKLKFAPFCSPLDRLFRGVIVCQIFRFWPKTIDYNRAEKQSGITHETALPPVTWE